MEKEQVKKDGWSTQMCVLIMVGVVCLTVLLICATPFVFVYFMTKEVASWFKKKKKSKAVVVEDRFTQVLNFYKPDYGQKEEKKR